MTVRVREVTIPPAKAVEDGGTYPAVATLVAGDRVRIRISNAISELWFGGPDLTRDTRYYYPSPPTVNPDYGKVYNGVYLGSPILLELGRTDFLYALNASSSPTTITVFEQDL